MKNLVRGLLFAFLSLILIPGVVVDASNPLDFLTYEINDQTVTITGFQEILLIW